MSVIGFSKDHEWVELDGDVGTVGISEYAQEQLGDIVFVELPEVGRTVAKGEEFAVVESVKAASEIYAPMTGEVVEVNEALNEEPATVNDDAQGAGWIVKIRVTDSSEFEELMDEEAYGEFLETVS
ncbi:MAG: glycine cleavage system protein GcvH [Sneathiellaceae bacterium]